MFINLSNHPSEKWDDNQLKAAACYGNVVDIPFPAISSLCNTRQVRLLANDYCNQCLSLLKENESEISVVHVAGELLFCYYIIQNLLFHNVTVVISASERNAEVDQNGVKRSEFHFVQFREIINSI